MCRESNKIKRSLSKIIKTQSAELTKSSIVALEKLKQVCQVEVQTQQA